MSLRFNSIKDLPPELANKVTKTGKTLAQEMLGGAQQSEDKPKDSRQANRGKEFEAQLEVTHKYYRMKRIADVHRNENEWRYSTEPYVKKLLAKGLLKKYGWAKTGDGSYIIMQRSMVDYAGGGKGFSVRFDAKVQSSGKRIAFSRFKDHQIKENYEAEQCGYAISGFMISFPHLKKIWFITGTQAIEYQNALMVGNVKEKSLSVEWLELHGIEIPITPNGIIDWYAAFVQKGVIDS